MGRLHHSCKDLSVLGREEMKAFEAVLLSILIGIVTILCFILAGFLSQDTSECEGKGGVMVWGKCLKELK